MAILIPLPGCSSWHSDRLGSGPVPGRTVRVRPVDGSRVMLREAAIAGDGVRGIETSSGATFSVATKAVVRAESVRLDTGKTLLAVGLLIAAGGVVLMVVGGGFDSFGWAQAPGVEPTKRAPSV